MSDVSQIDRSETVDLDTLRELSRDEILELKLLYEQDVAEIESQLDRAKARAKATGWHVDHNWWIRAKDARRWRGRTLQMIQFVLGEKNRAEKEESKAESLRFERAFLVATRRRVDEDLFEDLVADANAMVTSSSEKGAA